MPPRAASGGVAEASGSNYENLVATWYSTRILLGNAAQPDFDLPSNTRIVELGVQSAAAVDDVNLITSDDGGIFVQAKRTVTLSKGTTSSLGKAIDQFVSQFKLGIESRSLSPSGRSLDPSRDRLVLTTRNASSAKVTSVLPRLLRGVRDRASIDRLSTFATTDEEREVAKVVEDHIERAWVAACGSLPTDVEMGQLLRLIWVQTLDVEEGEPDRRSMLDMMRSNILADPPQSDSALSALIKRCGRLRAERSGSDASSLLAALSREGIALVPLPDFRPDVEALRRWTGLQLVGAHRFTRLLPSNPASAINRAAWADFETGAAAGSFLVVGDPGGGKSGLTYRLASEAQAARRDVVFLPIDAFAATSPADIQRELGITRPLAQILAHWAGQGRGLLVIDALDAARSLSAQTHIRSLVEQVLAAAGSRWSVIASVRSYDLRLGHDWRALFRGAPVSAAHADAEFASVRHIAVQPLTDSEIAQTIAFSPVLLQLFHGANLDLRGLLRNIFNLHLLADLVDQGAVGTELARIRTQSELLDTYWSRRVRRSDGRHDAREIALRIIVERMVASRSLNVFRADVVGSLDPTALVDLEQNGILRPRGEVRGPNPDILLFTHHVLFDYTVARLVFRRGRDASSLIDVLRRDRAAVVMAAPSLSIAFADLWTSDASRRPFWDLALSIEAESSLPATAHLAAPMVAAEAARAFDDLAPLLDALAPSGVRQPLAESVSRNLVSAINVRRAAGLSAVGQGAGPWMELAQALSRVGTDYCMDLTRVLVFFNTQGPEPLTPEQLAAAGIAARNLLEWGLRDR